MSSSQAGPVPSTPKDSLSSTPNSSATNLASLNASSSPKPGPNPQSPQSSAVVDGPSCINTLDCKVLQYQYSITKLEMILVSLQKLSTICTPKPDDPKTEKPEEEKSEPEPLPGTEKTPPPRTFDLLPLVQYIVLLAQSVFAINEGAFQARLDYLSNFKLIKPAQIIISSSVAHIPYDHQDANVTPLFEIPKIPLALKCLKILEILSNVCLSGYQKRLAQAKIEQQKFSDPLPSNYYEKIRSLVKDDLFDVTSDIDLTLDDITFKIPRDDNLLSNENFVEATLVDIDFKMLFLITRHVRYNLNKLKPIISKYRTLKGNLQSLPDFKYSLHKIFLLTLRLNDLYAVFRKFGRKIYLSNYQHLTDQKLTFQSQNPAQLKQTLLNSMEDIFNSAKKNGTLVANMTRFIRPGSRFEVSVKTINDFVNFVNQSFLILEGSVKKFEDFGNNWIIAELRFRKVYQLPKKNLYDIYQSVQESRQLEQASSRSSSITSLSSLPQKPEKLESFPSVSTPSGSGDVRLRKLDVLEPPATTTATTRTSRSSSLSSINSNSSQTLGRRGSINSPKRNSLIIPPSSTPNSKVSPSRPRPNSMLFLNSNNSLSSIDPLLESSKKAPTETPTGRRRSNSQPIGPPPPSKDAASGAAMALTKSWSPSPVKTVQKPASSFRKPNPPAPQEKPSSPPVTNKIQKQLLAVAEEDTDETVKATKLSANQRLQQHLRNAAKSGSLMTQEKEIFTSVTFDPNNPSGTKLRRPVEAASPEAAEAPTTEEEETKITAPVPVPVPTPSTNTPKISLTRVGPNRDQVTRRNTKRNSVSSPVSDTSIEHYASSSSSSSTSSSGVKKVRFIGVPEYTEAEDAPSKYANKILKNFAVFRNPTMNYAFKKRDQLLKREESISFKHHLDQTEEEQPAELPQLPPLSVNRFSKIRSKLM